MYCRFYSLLYYYGLKLVSDKELVKDCIQDIFIKIIQNHSTLSPTLNVKGYLIKTLRNKLLMDAFSRLSPHQQEIIYLYYVNELKHEDIAEILGINYQSSKNLLFRSLSKLKKIYFEKKYIFHRKWVPNSFLSVIRIKKLVVSREQNIQDKDSFFQAGRILLKKVHKVESIDSEDVLLFWKEVVKPVGAEWSGFVSRWGHSVCQQWPDSTKRRIFCKVWKRRTTGTGRSGSKESYGAQKGGSGKRHKSDCRAQRSESWYYLFGWNENVCQCQFSRDLSCSF